MLIRRDRAMVAVTVVLDVAFHGGRAATVSAADIAERLNLARRGMEPLLQSLSRGGVLDSVRGPKGGYLLAKERRRITMGEIVRAVRQFEGASDPVQTASGSRVGLEIVRPLWRELQQEMLVKLDNVTLEDLCQRAQTAGIRSDAHQRLDFVI